MKIVRLNRERENKDFSTVFTSSGVFISSASFCSFLLTSSTMRTVVTGDRIQLVNLLNLTGMLTTQCKNTASRSSTAMMKTVV